MSKIQQIKMSVTDKKLKTLMSMGNEITLERMPVPSIALNRALDGGFGRGRISMIYGPKSSAKTSFLLEMIAAAQKRGETCALIDAEQSYDPVWAARLGVNNEELIVVQAKTFEDAIDIGCKVLEQEIDLLVVDSISSLLSGAYFDDKSNLKDVSKTGQIGSVAKDTGKMVNMYNYSNHRTCIVLISQIRNKITTYGAVGAPTGGEAVKYFSSTIVKLSSSASDKEQIKENMPTHNGKIELPVGRPIKFRVEYSKTSNAGVVGEFNFYYGRDPVGVDNIAEIVDLAISLGFIRQAAAWFYLDEETKFNGRPALVQHIKDNPEVYEDILEKVMSVKPIVLEEDTEDLFGDDFE